MKKTMDTANHNNGFSGQFWQRRWFMGCCAGVLWFLVFSAGLLIDSLPHRVALGWKADDVNHDADIGRLARQLIKSELSPGAQGSTNPSGTIGPVNDDAARTVSVLTRTIHEQETNEKKATDHQDADRPLPFGELVYHFFSGIVLFTPINVALLALVAGFIGGCASNEADLTQIRRDIHDADRQGKLLEARDLRRRLAYLEEHPANSMMRSFIVYLVFISGLYVVATDPFGPATQAQGFTQYVRLAGLVSLLSFMVGYDPSRFNQWIEMVPSPVHSNHPSGEATGAILATAHMETAHANVQMQLKDTTAAHESKFPTPSQ